MVLMIILQREQSTFQYTRRTTRSIIQVNLFFHKSINIHFLSDHSQFKQCFVVKTRKSLYSCNIRGQIATNPKMQLQKAINGTEQGGMGANRCTSATSLTQGRPPRTAQQNTTRRVIRDADPAFKHQRLPLTMQKKKN